MSLQYNRDNIPRAKTLRKTMTPQERKLWYTFLRTYPVRFQRQKAIGNYIVDFYCAAAKVAIEIDGSQHYEDAKQIYDQQRDAYLRECQITVLRYSNREIDRQFDAVCADIARHIPT